MTAKKRTAKKPRHVMRWSRKLFINTEGFDHDFDYESPELTAPEVWNILRAINIKALVRAEIKKRPKDIVIDWNYI